MVEWEAGRGQHNIKGGAGSYDESESSLVVLARLFRGQVNRLFARRECIFCYDLVVH